MLKAQSVLTLASCCSTVQYVVQRMTAITLYNPPKKDAVDICAKFIKHGA